MDKLVSMEDTHKELVLNVNVSVLMDSQVIIAKLHNHVQQVQMEFNVGIKEHH